MDLLQLLQLNFKTLINLVKLFLLAVFVTIWTGQSFSLDKLFSILNVQFIWSFVKAYLFFFILVNIGLSLIGLGIYKLFQKKFIEKPKQEEYTESVLKNSEKALSKLNQNNIRLISMLMVHHNSIVNIGADISIIFILLSIVMKNYWLLLFTIFIVIASPMLTLGLQVLNTQLSNEHNRSNGKISD